jgi:hypothetical protein
MDFVKRWWIWILLGILVVAQVAVYFLVTADYVAIADENRAKLESLQEDVEAAVRRARAGRLPTRGDVAEAEEAVEEIMAERAQTAALWRSASQYLDERHGKDPRTEFNVFLHRSCRQMCFDLARDIAALRGLTGEALERAAQRDREDVLKNGEEMGRLYWVAAPADHQLADLTKSYETVAETMPVWRQFLISRKLHEVAGTVSAEVEVRLPEKDAEGNLLKDEAGLPVYAPGTAVRTVEAFEEIAFGEKRVVNALAELMEEDDDEDDDRRRYGRYGRDEDGADEEAEEREPGQYTVYPVTIELTAHQAVVLAYLRALQEAVRDGFFLVERSYTWERLNEEATQPAEEGLPAAGEPAPIPREVQSGLRVWHEPPVRATIEIDVYHFRDFTTGAEADEDGNGTDG